jgi:hypothetical protein
LYPLATLKRHGLQAEDSIVGRCEKPGSLLVSLKYSTLTLPIFLLI